MEVEVDDEQGCVLCLVGSNNSNLEDEYPSKDNILESPISENSG